MFAQPLSAQGETLSAQQAEKQGREALAAKLPDVAAARFQSALASEKLNEADQQRLRLLWIESLIRAGQPAAAQAVLEHPSLKQIPAALFWKAQMLSIEGRFQEAIAVFDQAIESKNFPYYSESVLSRSRLYSALGHHRDAIAGLNLLTTSSSPLAVRAQLDQTRLLLHTGKIADARKALPALKSLQGKNLLEAKILDASLLQAEGQFLKAEQAFQKLLTEYSKDRETLPEILHPAAVGAAKAMASLAKRAEATDALLAFIQGQPDSPMLDDAFELLQFLLGDKPAPEDPVVTLINERLQEWSAEQDIAPPALLSLSGDGAADHFPVTQKFEHPSLHANALYTRARSLGEATEKEAIEQQRQLLLRLRMEHPEHPLAMKGMIGQAKTWFRLQQFDKAENILQCCLEMQGDRQLTVNALLVMAEENHKRKEFEKSAENFSKAAEMLDSTARSSALFNAGLSWLNAGESTLFSELLAKATPKLKASLQLEQALVAASLRPQEALAELDRFLLENPDHPRVAEARLAMAYCALQQQTPALSLAKAQLDSLEGADPFPEKTLFARIQLAEISNDHANCIALCRQFTTLFPQSTQIDDVTLILGSALYRNGDLNDARLILQKLEKSSPSKAAPALLMAARAAARTGTPQSLIEAVELFDRVIQSNSSLAPFAVLEKARTLIDAKSPTLLAVAATELSTMFEKSPPTSEIHTASGLMLLETLYAQGGSDPTQYSASLTIQRKLLDHATLSLVEKHRISYFRGMTLEQLNKPEEALDVYYQVVESAATEAPSDWDFFERCGFNAIALLEKNKRWEPAIGLAKKLSQYPTPRAKEAAERAKRLGLDHMIWDD